MAEQLSKEQEKKALNMKACMESDVQVQFFQIDLQCNSKWKQSIHLIDQSVLLWLWQTTIKWKAFNFIWLNHLVHASNTTAAHLEEANNLLEMKSKKEISKICLSKRHSQRSQRFC
jgi:hypothetical protein